VQSTQNLNPKGESMGFMINAAWRDDSNGSGTLIKKLKSKKNNKKLGLVFLALQEEVEKLTKKKEKFTVQKPKQKHQDRKRKLQQ